MRKIEKGQSEVMSEHLTCSLIHLVLGETGLALGAGCCRNLVIYWWSTQVLL